jgi:tol-pal system protein YbgF
MKLRILLLAGLCIAGGQARAGLFSDDEARQQIQQVGTRVSALEESDKKQVETNSQQAETNKQQTRTMLDLQSQIESLHAELRSLRGQNEELTHNLQDADKRQKDFYVDLDTRVRHFETVDAAAPSAVPSQPVAAGGKAPEADDPVAVNRAYEAAYGLFKAGKHQDAITAFQEFLKKFPESVYAPNAYYEMGAAYFVLNDFKNALDNYQVLASKYSFSPKAPEAMLGIADCHRGLKDVAAAKKALKQLVAKYPNSEAAAEAKKRLAKPVAKSK